MTGDLIVDGTGGSSLPANITLDANGLSITDQAELDDRIGTINNFSVQHRGPDGEINTWLGNNFIDGGTAFENRGALYLWADIDERDNINGGVDTRRVDLTVSDDGYGNSVGKLFLKGPVDDFSSSRRFIEMSPATDEGDFYNGRISLYGHSTLNTVIGAKSYQGATGYENPFMGMIGSITTNYLSFHEIINDGNGMEYGSLSLSTTGSQSDGVIINPFTIYFGDNIARKIEIAKDANNNGTMNLRSDATDRSIRMHANLDGDGRSHIALDGESGRYVYLWGNGKIENNKAWIVEDWGTTTNQGAIQLFDASDLEMVTLAANDDGSTETYGYLRLQDNENSAELSLFGRGSIIMNNSLGEEVFSVNNQGQAHFGDYFGTPSAGVYLDGSVGNVSASGFVEADILISSDGLVQTSDARLKTNILPLKNTLSNVLKMRGVTYNWIDPSKSQANQIGVIAQEVEAIYPEFVHTDDKGMKSVNYSQMVAVLIEAMKEMNGKIESLETENASLKASISEMDGLKLQMKNLEGMMKKLAGESPSSSISNAQQK
uniref:tail fiber domain-containing protein n=1 Tax=Fulvivirga sp. TaxID=1931237 RepID=UPI004049066B